MAVFHVTVNVTLRKSILDPQGNATRQALLSLGFTGIRSVRIGKHIELSIEAEDAESAGKAAEMAARKLLANPVMDDFDIAAVRAIEESVPAGDH